MLPESERLVSGVSKCFRCEFRIKWLSSWTLSVVITGGVCLKIWVKAALLVNRHWPNCCLLQERDTKWILFVLAWNCLFVFLIQFFFNPTQLFLKNRILCNQKVNYTKKDTCIQVFKAYIIFEKAWTSYFFKHYNFLFVFSRIKPSDFTFSLSSNKPGLKKMQFCGEGSPTYRTSEDCTLR